MSEAFRKFAHKMSIAVGTPAAFAISFAIIIAWALMGPGFGYSDTWQLVINTGTTIVTFLMVFLIQNTQNRDARALHLKLDELIRADSDARNDFIDLEDLSDEDLDLLQEQFLQVKNSAEQRLEAISETLKSREKRG
jgi:low affinity Fe/Cu permease